jgi:hypothetical protein
VLRIGLLTTYSTTASSPVAARTSRGVSSTRGEDFLIPLGAFPREEYLSHKFQPKMSFKVRLLLMLITINSIGAFRTFSWRALSYDSITKAQMVKGDNNRNVPFSICGAFNKEESLISIVQTRCEDQMREIEFRGPMSHQVLLKWTEKPKRYVIRRVGYLYARTYSVLP